jgi:hypothetical protein
MSKFVPIIYSVAPPETIWIDSKIIKETTKEERLIQSKEDNKDLVKYQKEINNNIKFPIKTLK